MSFSAHEMIIFLRMRDEASRILGRFARNVQGVDAKIIAANSKVMADAQKERGNYQALSKAAVVASKQKIAAIDKEISKHKMNLRVVQQNESAIHIAKSKEIVDYKQRSAAIKALYSGDKEQMNAMLRTLKEQHEAQKVVYDEKLIKLREVKTAEKEAIRLLDFKKSKEVQSGKASVEALDKQITKYKELERQARDAIKAETTASKQRIAANQKHAQQLQNTGIALTTVGASATAAGIVTVNSLSDAADAAVEYRKAATSTLTQVDDKFKTTLNDIVDIGRNVAERFAVPIDEMQGAMYDLYSSMDVKNKSVASNFMVEAAKAAVGGSTDIKTATGALISTLNSYELKAKDVNKVNDLMFQLVRKGVGSYSDFTNAMATANPSAHRAGQTYQQTAAMLALLTRNGIKSAKAGTYTARAFDAISNPKTAKNMKEMGIRIYDAHGKMKPMVTIIDMMKKSMQGLTQEQRSAKLKDMFAGSGGNIQALKFYNTALADTTGTYKKLYKDMKNASKVTDENGKKVGAAKIAYNQMADADASKILIAQNKMAIAWQKIGDAIMPVKTAVYEFFGKLADWWNKLSPQQQQAIAQFAAISAVIMVVVGAIVTIVGVVMMLAAAFIALDAAALPIVLVVLAIIAVLALLAGAAYLIITNWDSISKFFVDLWTTVSQWTISTWNNIVQFFQNTWTTIVSSVSGFGQSVSKFFIDLWNGIVNNVISTWTGIVSFFSGFWNTYLKPVFGGMWEALQTYVATILSVIIALFTGKWGEIPGLLQSGFTKMFGFLAVGFSNMLGLVGNGLQAVLNFFTNIWSSIVQFTQERWNALVRWIFSIPSRIMGALSAIGKLGDQMSAWMRGVLNSAIEGGKNLVQWFKDLPGRIIAALGNLSVLLINAGKNVLKGFLEGLMSIWSNIQNFIGDIGKWIKDHKGPLSYDYTLLQPAGRAVMGGFNKSLKAGMDDTKKLVRGFNPSLTAIGTNNLSYANTGLGLSGSGAKIEMPIYTQEIDPVKHAADLGYEVSTRLGL